MNINPGELDKKIKIISCKGDVDSDGFRTDKPVVVRETWAKMTRTSGTEKIRNGAEMGDTVCRFLIRAGQQQISRDMLIEYKGELYDIEYANEYNDAHEYVEIFTKRQVPENGKV